jgi:hypothetical protein
MFNKSIFFVFLFGLLVFASGCTDSHKVVQEDSKTTTLEDNGNIDAFGRVRTSEVTSLLDVKMLHDKEPLFIDEKVNGGIATYNLNDSSVTMTTSANGQYVIRQTKQRTNYQAGKSHQIFMTFYDFAPQTNIVKRIGYFSSDITGTYSTSLDGLFLESSNGVISINVYKNGLLIESIPQALWNLDKLDGSGQSRLNINWDKSQILTIDFEWLGVGRVRWGLVINGNIYYFHESLHANNIQGVYMKSPNKPLRWEIRQTGVGSGKFTHICSSIGTEGSLNTLGVIRSVNTNGNNLNADVIGTRYALIGIRLKQNQIDNMIDILEFSTLGLTVNDNYYWELYLNPIVSGTFTYSNISNSAIMYALGSTPNTVSGGVLVDSGFVAQQTAAVKRVENALRLGTLINGTTDTFVLTITPLGSNLDIHGSITWREVR